MDGTRYVDGVLVDTTQLSRTEASKSFHILRDRLDNWENGINTGLVITVNPVNTSRVDLSAGAGYAVDGEYVEVLADQLNIQLADNALGATNWVVVFYTETKASPNPHETNGTIQPTENKRGVRVRVLTPTQFSALPLTDPTFTSDAQDRSTLVGIVTATGGALTSSNIEQPLSWRSLQYAVMAVPPLSGVLIYKVSDDTPEGATGVIKLDTAPNRLSWQAPSEAGFGASVNVPADGIYLLTALGGSTILVSVVVAALPLANAQVTVAIRGLYTQTVPRMSSTDRHHRSLIGTGLPGPTNPHGLSLDDISPGFATDITLHQQLMHDNGIWRGSSVSCLQVTIDEASSPDQLLITAPVGDDCYWVHGKRLTAIKNTVLPFNATTITANRGLFDVIVDNIGNVKYTQRLDHTGTNLAGPDNGVVFINDEVVAGNHTLTWLSLGAGNGGYLSWDNSATLTRVLPGTTSGLFLLREGKQEVWYYIANFSQLPGAAGAHSDVVSVFAPANRTENLLIAQVFYGGDSIRTLGYTNNRGAASALLVDLRMFGTLRDFNIRDDTLRDMIEYPMDEHHANGVCIGRKDFQGAFGSLWVEKPAAGLTLTMWGQAPVYVRGKRYVLGSFTAPLTATVPNNAVTVIYVDIDGNIAQVPFLYAAFLLLNAPDAFDSTKFYKTLTANYATYPWVYTGTPLAVVATAGGNVVRVIDMRRNLAGGNVNIRPWTVGSITPTPLFPAYQAVEFYSIDTALLYALVQGQERIECVYATLANPTLTPYQIPALKNMVLTGTLFIGEDWSTLTSVFQLGNGANITFEDLQIFQSASFVGAPTLSLVQTATGSTQPSTITFENTEIDWQNNGHLAHFIATGPTACSLQVDNLTVTSVLGAPVLFQVDAAMKPLDIQGVTTLGLVGPTAVIGASIDVVAAMSNCAGNNACAVASVAAGKSLRGTFAGLNNFSSPVAGGGSAFRTSWAGCSFGGINIATAVKVQFSACAVSGLTLLGTGAVKSSDVQLTGCLFENDAELYVDNLSVAGCEFTQGFVFGGEHIQVSATNIQRDVVHAAWASHDVNFTACSLRTFQHALPVALSDWHLVGCTVGSVVLEWGAEVLTNFTVSECKIEHLVRMQPTIMPQSAKSLKGTINDCDIDLTTLGGDNIQLNFCRDVRILGNRIKCVADFASPPIQIGQSSVATGQDNRDIEIADNEFYIDDVVMTIANIGSPVILLANAAPAPFMFARGITVRDNTFKWSTVDVTKLLVCFMYVSPEADYFRVDGNTLVFDGDSTNVQWDSGTGLINAHRMALFMGFRDVSITDHTITFLCGSFQKNMFQPPGPIGASKWICYDSGAVFLGGSIIVLGNTSSLSVRMNPVGVGAAFTDTSLNPFIDNT